MCVCVHAHASAFTLVSEWKNLTGQQIMRIIDNKLLSTTINSTEIHAHNFETNKIVGYEKVTIADVTKRMT